MVNMIFIFYFVCQDSSSPSFLLCEKVIGMCREKLKPVFQQLLKGTSLSEYSQIVTSVCEEGSDDKEDNNADPAKDTVSTITSMHEPLLRCFYVSDI
jgi:hypothetical protein